jgi:hypothetical protein
VVRNGEEMIDVLNSGQGVLNVLPLGGVKDEVDAAILEFRPAVPADTATPDVPSTHHRSTAQG